MPDRGEPGGEVLMQIAFTSNEHYGLKIRITH